MKFFGVDMQGPLHLEEVDTLPVWQASYKRRIIYNLDDDLLYIGTSIGWVAIGSTTFSPATNISVDTTNFDNKLSSSDDTVQKALDTLDDGMLSSIRLTDVDLTAIAQTQLYVVPTGRKFIITKLVIIVKSITGAGSMPTIQLGTSLIPADIIPAAILASDMNTVDNTTIYELATDAYAASEQIEFGVTVGGGSTTHTADIILEGILLPE